MLVLLVVTAQLLSSSVLISSRTCSHSKKTTYSLGKSSCTCPKEPKKQKSCCSVKTESKSETQVGQVCCDIDEIFLDVDYHQDINSSPIKLVLTNAVKTETKNTCKIPSIKDKDYSLYDPPPELFSSGLLKRIELQSFII